MQTKQDIIDAIKQTAKENGGKPLGRGRFEKETGIKMYEWNKYWARFGDALTEAGYVPNQLQQAYDNELLFTILIRIIRKLKKFPTYAEIRLERQNNPEIPVANSFQRLGTKEQTTAKLIEYFLSNKGLEDILNICYQYQSSFSAKSHKEDYSSANIGEVYLFKSGKYYKIGKTNDTVRRGNELRIQLPERMDLIHSIKTDDPSGIEAYWHNRFESKRMQGEWFDLRTEDLKAFKRWRRII